MNKRQRFWDRVAANSAPPNRIGKTAGASLEVALAHLSSEGNILDVGCGPGDLTLEVARHVASILAIDPSPGMIEVARSRLRNHPDACVTFEVADLTTPMVQEHRSTAVTAFNVLHYVDDLPSVARRVAFLLPEDGLFLSSTACLGEGITPLSLLMRLLALLRIVPPTRFYKLSQLTEQIASGGFRIVKTVKVSKLPEYFVVAQKAA